MFAAKAMFFKKKIQGKGFRRGSGVKKKFQKTLILIFEVIIQPPKTHFLALSSETKILKITHSGSGNTNDTRMESTVKFEEKNN